MLGLCAACGGRTLDNTTATDVCGTYAEDGSAAAEGGSAEGATPGRVFRTTITPPSCLPEALERDAAGYVACAVLVTLADRSAAAESVACHDPSSGLSVPPADVLQPFQAAQHRAWLESPSAGRGADPSTRATCELRQDAFDPDASCANGHEGPGWCYVSAEGDSSCPQGIELTKGTGLERATLTLQCAAP
jgi:hypothetical protein